MSERDAVKNQGNGVESSTPRLRHMAQRGNEINREWLGLRELCRYAALSERTLRSWIYSPVDPLPAAKVCGKVLVRKSDFDAYLDRYPVKRLEEIDVDAIVREVLSSEGGEGGR